MAFYPISEDLLHLGQKCVTMGTRNSKHNKIRRFPLIIGLWYMLQVFQKLKSLWDISIFLFLTLSDPWWPWVTSGDLWPLYPLEHLSKCLNLIFGVCSWNLLYIIQINNYKYTRSLGAISMHRSTPFLGISLSFTSCFNSLNTDTLTLILADIRHFDLIFEHLLHLGQKCVTMETRNLKYDMTRMFPPSIGKCYMLWFLKNLQGISENNFFQKIALCDLIWPFCTKMTPNSIGFICHIYVTTRCDIVPVECIESKKSEGQTNIQTNKHKLTNKQTNQRRQKDFSRRATITNKPTKQKDYTSPALAGAGDYN